MDINNLTDEQQIYLEGITSGMDYAEASALAGIDRSTGYRWRQDPGYMGLIRAARRVTIDRLKEEAERRAMRGSDKLLEFLLCNYAPEQFKRAQSVDLTAKIDLNTMSEEQIRAELAALAAQGFVPAEQDDGSDLI